MNGAHETQNVVATWGAAAGEGYLQVSVTFFSNTLTTTESVSPEKFRYRSN